MTANEIGGLIAVLCLIAYPITLVIAVIRNEAKEERREKNMPPYRIRIVTLACGDRLYYPEKYMGWPAEYMDMTQKPFVKITEAYQRIDADKANTIVKEEYQEVGYPEID